MSESTKRVTKADLEAQVLDRDAKIADLHAQLDGAYARITELEGEVGDGAQVRSQLEGTVLQLVNHGDNLASSLQEARDVIDQAQEEIDNEIEAAEQVETWLATLANDLFNRLLFVSQTLGTIVCYQGQNISTLKELASTAANEVVEVVDEGVRAGLTTIEGVVNLAATELVIALLGDEESESTPAAECCGGACHTGGDDDGSC